MDVRKFQSAVDELLSVIGRLVNLKAFPYLPIIYSSLFYFIRKRSAYRQAVRAMPAGPRSRRVANKPKKFVDDFLQREAPFALNEPDPRRRRKIFGRLYPVLGLRDPFLISLFRERLDRHDLQTIVDEFDKRLRTALDQIPAPRSSPDFWQALDTFVETAAGLTIDLAREREIQDLIIARAKRFLGAGRK